MTKFSVVGISGKAGSGKDFIAQQYFLPRGYTRFSLAWHFKVWLVGKGEATYEEVFHTKPSHIRKLLQEEGTERGRNVYGENVWCHTMGAWMTTLSQHSNITRFVIPDIRFENEVEYIKSIGGIVLRLDAPIRASNNSLTPEARQHISETALDTYKNFDGVIYNDVDYTSGVEDHITEILNTLSFNA